MFFEVIKSRLIKIFFKFRILPPVMDNFRIRVYKYLITKSSYSFCQIIFLKKQKQVLVKPIGFHENFFPDHKCTPLHGVYLLRCRCRRQLQKKLTQEGKCKKRSGWSKLLIINLRKGFSLAVQ